MARPKTGWELSLEQQGEIKKRLKMRGLTGTDIAKKCGITRMSVSNVLCGRQPIPRRMQVAIYDLLNYDTVATREVVKQAW
jgi:transcriptional regulator with XRE-family HTH domain